MTSRKSLFVCVLFLFSLANVVVIFLKIPLNYVTNTYSTQAVRTEKINLGNPESIENITEVNFRTLFQLYNNSQRQLNIQNDIISLLSEPIINNHNFSYIHNPTNTCDSELKILFVTPSSVDNFDNRVKVRHNSLASYIKNSNGHSKLLFFLGLPKNKDSIVQDKINMEFLQYGDIVQEEFEDIYGNIRLKAVSMLKWAVTFCPNAKFVIRTDDDVKVDPQKLVSALERKSAIHTNFVLGHRAEKWEPIRNRRNKYFLSAVEYPHSTFPPFALGGLLGYPMSTVKLLYQAALRVPPIWLDDVFITGICAAKVNVSVLDDPDFEFQHWVW